MSDLYYTWIALDGGAFEDQGNWSPSNTDYPGVPDIDQAGTISSAYTFVEFPVFGGGSAGYVLVTGNDIVTFYGSYEVVGLDPTNAANGELPYYFSAFEVNDGASATFNGDTSEGANLTALSEVMVGDPTGAGTLSFINGATGTLTATNSATALDVAYANGITGLVVVDDSTLTLNGGAYIGVFGNGVLDISNQGLVQLVPDAASYDDFEVGAATGATGDVSVSYGTLALGEFTVIGDGGDGIISFTEGAVGSFSGAYYAGGSFGSSFALYLGGHGGSGTLVVDGSFNTGIDPTQAISTVTTDAGIVVGQYGNGLVELTNQGTLAIDGAPGAGFSHSEVGEATGSTGTIIVTSFASLSASEYVAIGDGGTGTVTFSYGASGSFNSDSGPAITLGGQGGSGSLTIQDGDTTVDTDAGIYVGASGTGVLTLTSGATLAIDPSTSPSANSFSEVGVASGSTGLVTVSENAQLTGTSQLRVGDEGTGTLDITTGGSVSLSSTPGNLAGAFGYGPGGVGIGLIDDGLLDSVQSLSVGYQGSGTLTIQDQGVLEVDNGNLRIARDPGSSGLLTVNGGDIYAQGAVLTVGPDGTNPGDGTGGLGTLEIESGSVFVGSAQIAGLGGGTGSIDVTGGAGLNITGMDLTTGAGTSIITAEDNGGIGVTGAITIGGGGGSALVQITDGASLYDYGSGITLGALGTLALDDSAYLQAATLTLAGGTLDLLASRTFDGPLIVTGDGAGTDGAIIGAPGADLTLSGGITFATGGSQGVLLLGPAFDTGTEIEGFAAGDTLDIAGQIYNTASYDTSTQQLILSNTIDPLALNIADNGYSADSFSAYTDGNGGTDVSLGPPPCYLAGTRIATPDGERRVEELRPGDRVTLAGGGHAPLIWVGERRLDPTTHPRAWEVLPIRIRRDALDTGLPRRDLLVSPDHALLLDGVLVEAKRLVNGRTIIQEAGPRSVRYFHLELARHHILLAEGVAAESYLDTGNRRAFADADAPLLHPSFAAPRAAVSCAPFATAPDVVRPIWQRLDWRAVGLGHAADTLATTADPAARLRINGRLIAPLHAEQGRLCFALPPGARRLRLVSRAAQPAWCRPWLDDRRALGLNVARIRLRGQGAVTDLPLDGPHLAQGWWDLERAGNATHRWTNGDAAITLPFAADTLELTASQLEAYPLSATNARPPQRVAALAVG